MVSISLVGKFEMNFLRSTARSYDSGSLVSLYITAQVVPIILAADWTSWENTLIAPIFNLCIPVKFLKR